MALPKSFISGLFFIVNSVLPGQDSGIAFKSPHRDHRYPRAHARGTLSEEKRLFKHPHLSSPVKGEEFIRCAFTHGLTPVVLSVIFDRAERYS